MTKRSFSAHFLQSPVACASIICASVLVPSQAIAQLNLMREPSNARVTEPAPNILLSLDDSGSMGWDLEGCATRDWRVDVYGEFNEAGAVNCPGRGNNNRPSRMTILRNALLDTFGNPTTGSKGIIPDNRIRLAWQSMWDNGRASRPSYLQNWQDSIAAGQPNSIRPFSGNHRDNFHFFVTSLTPVYGTPSHKMMSNVRNYMFSGSSINSPFASNPGIQAEPYLGCRRSYHIFMTDGAWNSETGAIGNYDGTSQSFPDGAIYSTTDAQTRAYRDSWGGSIGTLADWAMANWATDFQTGIPNQVKPIIKHSGNEIIGSTSLNEYWNPKNNPMTWQGVTQYAIGFGTSATRWTTQPPWGTDTHAGTGYTNLINGAVTWGDVFSGGEPARPMDLWHMALNGRGKYYQARSSTDLRTAFNDILQTILIDTSSPLAAGASSNIKAGIGGQAFLTAYDGGRWKGEIRALTIGRQNTVEGTLWDGGKLLNERDFNTRRILTHNGSSPTVFSWSNLSETQKTALRGTDGDSAGTQRLDYLRGDRSQEQPSGALRERDSRLGSLVNSVPVYMGPPTASAVRLPGRNEFIRNYRGRPPVLFVGSNGGMLHAFHAGSGAGAGKELFAYVPRGVYNKLRDYTAPSYQHQFTVDGSPLLGDVNLGSNDSPNWRSVLVGTLGLGGRGFFALDVTDPSRFEGSNPMPPSELVLFDRTEPSASGAEQHVGHIASPPVSDELDENRSSQIVRLNDGRSAVVLGNGVNSLSGRAALLIQYLDGNRNLMAITAGTSSNNGLGSPRLVDLDGNGTADLAYAGDQQGNLWSFDLTHQEPGQWAVRFSGQPLFVARDASGVNLQPITAAPYVIRVPRSQEIQVAFGTGRLMDIADTTSTRVQTLYSVRDNLRFSSANGVLTLSGGSTISNGRSSLLRRVSGSFVSGYAATSTETGAGAGSGVINYKGDQRGWFMDLEQAGERQINNPEVFQDSIVRFATTIPATQQTGESCNLSTTRGRFFWTYLDIFSGTPAPESVFGFKSPTTHGMPSTSISRSEMSGAVTFTLKGPSEDKLIQCTNLECKKDDVSGTSSTTTSLAKTAPKGALVDWRRLQ